MLLHGGTPSAGTIIRALPAIFSHLMMIDFLFLSLHWTLCLYCTSRSSILQQHTVPLRAFNQPNRTRIQATTRAN